MALTRDASLSGVERIKRDPALAKVLLDEAATLFLNGEPDVARLTLRDLVNGTIGFERLADETGKPAKSLIACYLQTAIQVWITCPLFSGCSASGLA